MTYHQWVSDHSGPAAGTQLTTWFNIYSRWFCHQWFRQCFLNQAPFPNWIMSLSWHYKGQCLTYWIVLKILKIYLNLELYLLDLAWPKQIKLNLKQKYIWFLSYTANIRPTDVLATLGASASGGMVLTPKPGIFPWQHQNSLNKPKHTNIKHIVSSPWWILWWN